jgi:hypothetical protein
MYSFPSPIELLFSLFHFILLPIAFLVCLFRVRKRKKPELYCALLTIFYYVVFYTAANTGTYALTLQVLDPSRQPVADLAVGYSMRPGGDRFGRFSRVLGGVAKTDQSGEIQLRPNHAHSIFFWIRDSRYTVCSFTLERAGKRYSHKILPDWETLVFVDPPEGAPRSAAITIDPQPQHRIVIALKPAEPIIDKTKQLRTRAP